MWLRNLFRHLTLEFFSPGRLLKERYAAFKALLSHDKRAHELMADLEEIRIRKKALDHSALKAAYQELSACVSGMIDGLITMNPAPYKALPEIFKQIDRSIRRLITPPAGSAERPYALALDELSAAAEQPQTHKELCRTEACQMAGGKAANLAWIAGTLGLPVPQGFVVTTRAFRRFIEENGLRPKIDEVLSGLDIHDTAALQQAASTLQEMILGSSVPKEVEEEINAAAERLEQTSGPGLRLAVRSSALAEDARMTFAGQYRTVLDVDTKGLIPAYIQVLASKYSPRALFYRISCGYSDQETAMAVLVLEMIEARASGVIFTSDPDGLNDQTLLIYAARGQGEALVSGRAEADLYIVSKGPEPEIAERRSDAPESAPVEERHILELARWAKKIEAAAGTPQDVEWCLDTKGRLFILQTRPLHRPAVPKEQEEVAISMTQLHDAEILLSGGETASSGIAAGRVFILKGNEGLHLVPEGAMLTAQEARPRYAALLDRISGIVTDSGSPAGHLALVAREFQVPMLVNTKRATRVLKEGQEVTLLADRKMVAKGSLIPPGRRAARPGASENPFFQRLELMLRFITPLNLTDPSAENFRPEGCRTIHDIVRFCHERAVREMFSTGEGGATVKGAKRLRSRLPVTMYLVDLGGGLAAGAESLNEITPDHIACRPLRAVWRGLEAPGICWADLTRFDWKGFDQVVMAGGIASKSAASLATYAVVSADYLNLNMRFGYHFLVLDSICGQEPQKNYIMFRFAGGGGQITGRLLRARFLEQVLTSLGFSVETKADMLDASVMGGDARIIEDRLEQLGRLAAVSQLMDMYLKDEAMASDLAEAFLRGDYSFTRRMEPELCKDLDRSEEAAEKEAARQTQKERRP